MLGGPLEAISLSPSPSTGKGGPEGILGQRRTEAQGGPLTSFPSTTGEEAAGGDKLIRSQDLAWLQQADGGGPRPACKLPGVLDPLDLPGSPPPRDSPEFPSHTARLCRVSLTSPRVSLSSQFVAEVTQPLWG